MDFNSRVRIILFCTCEASGDNTPWDEANAITQKIENFISGGPSGGSYLPDYKPIDEENGTLQVIIDYTIAQLSDVQTLITRFRNNVDALGPYTNPPSFRFRDEGILEE